MGVRAVVRHGLAGRLQLIRLLGLVRNVELSELVLLVDRLDLVVAVDSNQLAGLQLVDHVLRGPLGPRVVSLAEGVRVSPDAGLTSVLPSVLSDSTVDEAGRGALQLEGLGALSLSDQSVELVLPLERLLLHLLLERTLLLRSEHVVDDERNLGLRPLQVVSLGAHGLQLNQRGFDERAVAVRRLAELDGLATGELEHSCLYVEVFGDLSGTGGGGLQKQAADHQTGDANELGRCLAEKVVLHGFYP